MPRFVVLHHQTPPESSRPTHWDLMLEEGDHLTTWALPSLPTIGQQLLALPLANHRLDYLDYEGTLTENRGTVTRYDCGMYEKIIDDQQQQVIELRGKRICGRATIGKNVQKASGVTFCLESQICNAAVAQDR